MTGQCNFPVDTGHVMALNFKNAIVTERVFHMNNEKFVKVKIPMLAVFKTKKRMTLKEGIFQFCDHHVSFDTRIDNDHLKDLLSHGWIWNHENRLYSDFMWDGEYLSHWCTTVERFSKLEEQYEELSEIYDNLPNLPQEYTGWWNLQ